jgi:2'-5' RNA ligase
MSKRLFVAIDLPAGIRRSLGELDPQLPGVRWAGPEQMHLTLGFFGQVPEEAELRLRERLADIRFGAFALPVQGIGTFPGKGPPKIIWISVGSAHPHLFQVHKRVQEAALGAGLEPDLRPWHPHITLARCRDVPLQPVRKFLARCADYDAGMFRVEVFHLYASKLTPAGSIYTRELTVAAKQKR